MKTNWKRAACRVAVAVAAMGAAFGAVATEPAVRCGLWMPEGAACPLKHTDVEAVIEGFAARVTVVQRYENPSDRFIEAVYTFPMSDRGAVDTMTMKIGDRTIRGIVEEKGKAQQMYTAAKNAGQAASLLDQERPNIFTQSVANIPPGETVEITLSYVEFLPYKDSRYTFTFPMVVGPRYNPAQVTDAARITPPVTPENTRAGHDIAVRVHLDAGVPVLDVKSELHGVSVEKSGSSKAEITLQQQDNIPNRDFVLNYKVAGDEIRDAVLTQWDEGHGYFALVMQPPAPSPTVAAASRELIFVIDCSGSMSGFPIDKARDTMSRCLDALRPGDTFNLMSFAGGVGFCFPKSVMATTESIAQARTYLGQLQGGGGTEMMKAIQASLATPVEADRLRLVCFMTDGYIGNDYEVLGEVKKHAGQARVFSFGIGNSVNRFLIEGMAREGRGASEIVTLASDGDEAAKTFAERIQSPVLRDIKVRFEGVDVCEVTPSAACIPDLFDAQPLVVMGRFDRPGKGTAVITGMTSDGPYEKRVALDLSDGREGPSPIRALWAREQVAQLMHEDWLSLQQGGSNGRIQNEITRLGLAHRIVTPFTSFVAVEDRVVNGTGHVETIAVPVEMADGVSYEGISGGGLGQVKVKAQSESLVRRSAPMPTAPAADQAASAPAESLFQGRQDSPARVREMKDEEDDSVRENKAAEPSYDSKEQSGKLSPAVAKLLAAAGPADVLSVVLKVADLTDARIDALRALGVKVGAVNRGSGEVKAEMTADVLRQVLSLAYVTQIKEGIS